MKVSKLLSAAAATAAVVGAIGFTYAQSSMDKSGVEAPAANQPSTTPATPPSASPSTTPNANPSTTDSGMASERAARADRG
ncbi:MAG TPA: hypothetical protein VK642_05480 [Burkholderiales bacterium]|nr:hypothetical protein [Burkholderiales bacterium]